MSVSEFRSRLQFTFPYRNVFQSVLSQFPLSYYNLRPLLGVLYRFAQYEIFLILQFTFQQQIVLKAKTMLNNEAITIHVPTQERYNRCYFEVYFNSHSHVWSAPQILVLAYTFYNSRSRIGNAMKIVANCLITIHVPTQGTLIQSAKYMADNKFQFTLPYRERQPAFVFCSVVYTITIHAPVQGAPSIYRLIPLPSPKYCTIYLHYVHNIITFHLIFYI